MDQPKQQDCFQLMARLPAKQIKRRIIETIFALIGYFLTEKTTIPSIFGTLIGGLIGMMIAQIAFPEEGIKKLTGKLDTV